MRSVRLPCGCVVDGEPPNVRHIWLCKKHRVKERMKGADLVGGILKKGRGRRT